MTDFCIRVLFLLRPISRESKKGIFTKSQDFYALNDIIILINFIMKHWVITEGVPIFRYQLADLQIGIESRFNRNSNRCYGNGYWYFNCTQPATKLK